MVDQTVTAGTPVLRMDIPITQSAEEIYDAIMIGIEPELTTAQIPTLAEKYKNETPAEKAARDERYAKASAEYDRQLAAFNAAMKQKVRSMHREAMGDLENAHRDDEAHVMSTIESSLLA